MAGVIRYAVFGIALLIGTIAGGCAGRIVTTEIHADSVFRVRLQSVLGEDKKPVDRGYQHPLSVAPGQMLAILGSIQVDYRPGMLRSFVSGKQPRVGRAFSEDEMAAMADGFSAAFSRATPADRIEFQFRHKSGIFSAGITSGVMYADNDRIELLLGNYRARPLPKGGRTEEDLQDPLEDIGSDRFTFVAGPHQELAASDPDLHDRRLIIDYRSLLESPPASGEPPTSEGISAEEGIEKKLETLERLREKGLINEDEYLQKKKEILDAF